MPPSAVFELRRYRLRTGARETLMALFEREFIHTQEAVGMRVDGQYRDLDDPDAFVWFRSFPGMAERAQALAAFYGGPVWREHGAAANETMLNSDNVLLLRLTPETPRPFDRGVRAMSDRRPSADATATPTRGFVTVSTASLAPGCAEAFAAFFAASAAPLIAQAGARLDAAFVTDASANTFPRLPVREGETVFVWVEAFADAEAHIAYQARLAEDSRWRDSVFPALDRQLWRRLEIMRLAPAAASRHCW